MTTSTLPTHDIHPKLQSVARRLSAWRSTRQRGQRIPEDLWKAAVTLARSHGLNPTASALKLNYYDLQRRLGSAPVHGGAAPLPSAFVELAAPSPVIRAEGTTLELVRPSGSRVILRLTSDHPTELCPLVELFLRS
jgi:hypothetical protein